LLTCNLGQVRTTANLVSQFFNSESERFGRNLTDRPAGPASAGPLIVALSVRSSCTAEPFAGEPCSEPLRQLVSVNIVGELVESATVSGPVASLLGRRLRSASPT
jgi:hypothetical protein